MILCLGTTPAVQRVMVFKKLALDAVNRAATTVDGIAGKSVNVAKVLKALGEQPLATGFVGGDRGEEIRRALTALGIAHEFVEVPARTRQCITVIDEAAGTQTELVEESRAVPAEAFERLLEVYRERVPQVRAVVLSGTVAPVEPGGAMPHVDLYRLCLQFAHAVGILTVLDAQGPPLLAALPARPGLVKPNRAELMATTGRALTDEAAVLTAMRELHEMGAARVVITAGERPTLAFDGRAFWRITPPPIQALNPIGSGDAFTAALTRSLLRGDDLGESCRWAAATGAANALTLMAGEVHQPDVERLAAAVVVHRLA